MNIPLHVKLRMGIWIITGLIVLILLSPIIPDDQVLEVELIGCMLVSLGTFVMFWKWFRSEERDGN